LFIWLCVCLALGSVMHYVMAGALSHRAVQILAAPGMVIRKLCMSVTALACGATVTRVRIYDLASRDIDFQAHGVSRIADTLVPVAPLFGSAVAMMALNVVLGGPVSFRHAPPALASLDTPGLSSFCVGIWHIISRLVEQMRAADWRSTQFYLLLGFAFSLGLGAGPPPKRIRKAILGAALLTGALALLASLTSGGEPAAVSPQWADSARSFIVNTSGAAFAMLVYGVPGTLVVGCSVRVYELMARTGKRKGKSAGLSTGDESRAA